MKSVSPRELCRALEANGWYHARTSGSHHIYKQDGNENCISVPVHNGDLKTGLLRKLMKLAELTEDDL